MSGLSGSETFSTEDAVTVAAEMAKGEGRIIPWDRSSGSKYWLYTTSRNSWLEIYLRKVIRANGIEELAYLTSAFDSPRAQSAVTALHGHLLTDAIEGHRRLMESAQLNHDFGVPELAEMLEPQELARELARSPNSVDEAIEEYNLCKQVDEGDGVPTLISFLRAHRLILEAAARASLTVVYAVWLY